MKIYEWMNEMLMTHHNYGNRPRPHLTYGTVATLSNIQTKKRDKYKRKGGGGGGGGNKKIF